MNELDIDTTIYDEEYDQQQLDAALQKGEADRQAAEAEQAAPAKVEAPEQKKEEKGEFLGGAMDVLDNLGVQNPLEAPQSINDMGGKARAVAGGIDTVMDLTSKFIPAMQDPADWWDEKTGRKTASDPYKKAERDMSAVVMPMLLTGGLIGGATKAAGLTGKTKLGADALLNFGVDALVSGTSDTTSEAGNLASLLERFAPGGVKIPWASRDGESPDVIYWKNMAENMVLGSIDPIVTALYAGKGGNKIVPKNDVAESLLDDMPPNPIGLDESLQKQRDIKFQAQIKEGRKARKTTAGRNR